MLLLLPSLALAALVASQSNRWTAIRLLVPHSTHGAGAKYFNGDRGISLQGPDAEAPTSRRRFRA